MTTLIYGIVFILLITILVTIANLVFSISEIKDDGEKSKQHILKVIKIAVFILIKIVLFALIINLIMFSFFGDELDLDNIYTQILTIFISFQIIAESISINRLLKHTVKKLNEATQPLTEYIEKVGNLGFFGYIIKVNKFVWLLSSALNIVTVIFLIVLMCFNFTLFYQNMFIYFLVLIYIKYLTFTTFYGKTTTLKK